MRAKQGVVMRWNALHRRRIEVNSFISIRCYEVRLLLLSCCHTFVCLNALTP